MKQTLKILLLSSALLSACAGGANNYQRPSVETPAQFSKNTTQTPTSINADWWRNFKSDALNDLMLTALDNNNDIRGSLARIEQARASLKIAGADLLPSISASSSGSRTFERNPTDVRSSISLGADISYELDLFGGNRAGVSAARANFAAAQFESDALRLVIMSDVARGYFTLLSLRERLDIADENLRNAREVSRIISARFDAGAVSALDVAQQKAVVATREANRANLAKQMTMAENALAILAGRAPQSVAFKGNTLAKINVPAIVAGQPSTLLERRPDIQSAEAGLIAANANITAARAALFPTITLGTNLSSMAAGFGNPATSALALAAQLAVPIFQGGRLEGGVEKATATQTELAESYRKTVLTSFGEVEDALAALKAADIRSKALGVARDQSRQAYSLSRQQYDAGSIDFQRLLDTQDALLSAQDSYAQTRLETLSAAVDLYKALGGGWK